MQALYEHQKDSSCVVTDRAKAIVVETKRKLHSGLEVILFL